MKIKHPFISNGHPVHCTKAELKGTKKCNIMANGLDVNTNRYVIMYESGISTGMATFENSDKGITLMKKFLKLLEK